MANHTESYKQRNASGVNKAEEIFESYCKSRGLDYQRFGSDEKNGYIKCFPLIPQPLRSLPDYIISKDNKAIFVHVKGTNKLKISDLINYGSFYRNYCGVDVALWIAFCFEKGGLEKIELKNWYEIETKMIDGLKIKHFDNDKKLYLEIPIS